MTTVQPRYACLVVICGYARLRALCAVAILGLLLTSALRAASVDWDNESADGNWLNALNWSTNGVPSFPDDATFINGAAGAANITALIPSLRDIRFGDAGRPGAGTVNHSAGMAQLSGWFRMGVASGSGGTYNLSGTGNLNVNGRVFIAEAAGTTARFAQTGGTLTFAAANGNEGLHIGENGAGVFDLIDGIVRQGDTPDRENQDSWNRIGQNAGSTGTFNISGGTVSFDSRTLVGLTGSGTVNQTGGTLEVRRHELVVADTTANGVYNISGGTLQTLEAGRPITIGQWDNSDGQLNVSGTAQVISAGSVQLGVGRVEFPSKGTVTQTGGTVTVGTDLVLGTVNGTAIYNMQGGVLDLTGGIIGPHGGSATFNFRGGRLTDAATIDLPIDQQGGVLAPSSSDIPSLTSVNGDYALSLAGTLEISLFPFGASDILSVTGAVTLAGNLDLVSGPGLQAGRRFVFLENDGAADAIVGTFVGRADESVFVEDGYVFQIDYQAGDGNDVGVLVLVPEPGAGMLMLLPALITLARRRPRKT